MSNTTKSTWRAKGVKTAENSYENDVGKSERGLFRGVINNFTHLQCLKYRASIRNNIYMVPIDVIRSSPDSRTHDPAALSNINPYVTPRTVDECRDFSRAHTFRVKTPGSFGRHRHRNDTITTRAHTPGENMSNCRTTRSNQREPPTQRREWMNRVASSIERGVRRRMS